MLPSSPSRQRLLSVHPERYQGFDPTFARGIILYTCGDSLEMYRTNVVAVFGRWRPRHAQKCLGGSGSTPHGFGHRLDRHIETRGRPHGHGGRRRSSSSSNTPHLMVSSTGRSVKAHGSPHGPSGAVHIELTSHGPRPCPAHQTFRGWAAARPGPSHFNFSRPRPGPSHFQFLSARLGPSNFPNYRHGPARPITFSNVSDRPGPARHNFQIGPAWPGAARPRQTAHDKPWFI